MIDIKSKSDIEKMKAAGQIVAGVFVRIEENILPGITTKDLDRIAMEYIIKSGAVPSFLGVPNAYGGMDFPAAICASVNEELIHGIPDKKRHLKEGDIVSIDVGAQLKGFHADAARTYTVGKCSDEALRLIEVTRQSFFEGVRCAVPGKRICDIAGAVQDYVERNGYSVVRDYTGHGVGREIHEAPEVPNYRTGFRGPRLIPGMAIAIEPMVNQGGWEVEVDAGNKWTVYTKDRLLSAHYENTVIVTDGEPIITTLAE